MAGRRAGEGSAEWNRTISGTLLLEDLQPPMEGRRAAAGAAEWNRTIAATLLLADLQPQRGLGERRTRTREQEA